MRRSGSLRKAFMDATIPNAICNAVGQSLPSVKQGSLRVWGIFFGRPYDNIHKLGGCSLWWMASSSRSMRAKPLPSGIQRDGTSRPPDLKSSKRHGFAGSGFTTGERSCRRTAITSIVLHAATWLRSQQTSIGFRRPQKSVAKAQPQSCFELGPLPTPLRHWESPLSGREIGGLSDFGVAAAMDEAENYSALVPMAG